MRKQKNDDKILCCVLYCHWNCIQEKFYHMDIEINTMKSSGGCWIWGGVGDWLPSIKVLGFPSVG